MKVSDFLRVTRNAKRLTLRDLEEKTGGKVSNAYISQIETGKIESPSVETLYHLAIALDLSPCGLIELIVKELENAGSHD